MSRRSEESQRINEAIDRLADLMPNGHVFASVDPAGFIYTVAEEIEELRTRLENLEREGE